MEIAGLEGLTEDELRTELANGARFVIYSWTFSLLVVTVRRASAIRFVRADESRIVRGLPFTLATLLLGWWGIPWGPLHTVGAIAANLAGGRDVTRQLLAGRRRAGVSLVAAH